MTTKFENPIQLCSKCAVHEIASWVFENQLRFDEETIKQIREELKDVKLKPGTCIACSHNNVSDSCLERIASVLEKTKSNPEAVSEFRKLFGLSPELISL
ncbi:MAG: hypothetical protein KKB21_05445 [Nanoarchaeota archaeon]|nr:hypothetical protein [Nanoarchaeota archaeon]MBU4086991.1 hypothetical protein [Nanoarchaeota archaeon]